MRHRVEGTSRILNAAAHLQEIRDRVPRGGARARSREQRTDRDRDDDYPQQAAKRRGEADRAKSRTPGAQTENAVTLVRIPRSEFVMHSTFHVPNS